MTSDDLKHLKDRVKQADRLQFLIKQMDDAIAGVAGSFAIWVGYRGKTDSDEKRLGATTYEGFTDDLKAAAIKLLTDKKQALEAEFAKV